MISHQNGSTEELCVGTDPPSSKHEIDWNDYEVLVADKYSLELSIGCVNCNKEWRITYLLDSVMTQKVGDAWVHDNDLEIFP